MKSWVKVKKQLPAQGQENRHLLWLGNLKYPFQPHIVWGYSESGKWWCQWGELDKEEVPTHWFHNPNPPRTSKVGNSE